jgi:pimeloyl-ACP methyl ester carboxylesterase
LILFGENGWFGRLSEQLRAELKDARVEVILGLGHLMAMEDPGLVATKAVEFLSTANP